MSCNNKGNKDNIILSLKNKNVLSNETTCSCKQPVYKKSISTQPNGRLSNFRATKRRMLEGWWYIQRPWASWEKHTIIAWRWSRFYGRSWWNSRNATSSWATSSRPKSRIACAVIKSWCHRCLSMDSTSG